METKKLENFSIIVPTYQEAKNIPDLVAQIASVDFGQRQFEVILSDDNSQDGTTEIVKSLRKNYPWLKLLTRSKPKNLSQSILDGFDMAIYPIVITLDADLSHPPEKIPAMLDILTDPAVDAVIGSRYVKDGSTDPSWPFIRVLSSKFAAYIAQVFLFTKIKDPLSGYLAIRKKTLQQGAPLNPIGWKIGLEIIIKCKCKNVREIPILFSQRRHGTSKLTFKISFDYLRHVVHLMWYRIFA
ncbi:MAG: polyprenol monophosphomannose synthase [Pseudomonadota bacterium]